MHARLHFIEAQPCGIRQLEFWSWFLLDLLACFVLVVLPIAAVYSVVLGVKLSREVALLWNVESIGSFLIKKIMQCSIID